jgi:GMP synthase-like glutamine amidotransferase
MRIHCFQHVEFEGLGAIADWITDRQHTLTYTYFYSPDYQLPKLEDFDFLIVLGGYMSANDETKFEWLKKEKTLISAAIKAQKYVLGICLGSQIVANVLGAKVFVNPRPEVGFWPINFHNHLLTNNLAKNPQVFQWHYDTFDLPEGAIHLAENEACKNQAFIWGNRVLGLQFHLEMDKATLQKMLESGLDAEPDIFVQSETEVREKMNTLVESRKVLFQLLDNFFTVDFS